MDTRYRFDSSFVPFHGYHTSVETHQLLNEAIHSASPYYLCGVRAQLHPKAWAHMLTSGTGVDPDINFVLDGILHGFNVVNKNDDIPSYYCKNYASCFVDDNLEKLRNIIETEVTAGKLTLVESTPTCVHSMGVIKKRDSTKICPITDCSKPDLVSVNEHGPSL